MTKGIREYTSQRFNKLLPRVKELGPTGFRRRVMEDVMKQFDITVASAATAYNYVLKTKREEDPDSVEGIGRGQDPVVAADTGRGGQGGGRGRQGGATQQNRRSTDKPGQAGGTDNDAGGRNGNGGGNGGGRAAAKTPAATTRQTGDNVAVIKARSGEVVVESMPRNLAKDLVANSGGRGRPKLMIQEDQEEEVTN